MNLMKSGTLLTAAKMQIPSRIQNPSPACSPEAFHRLAALNPLRGASESQAKKRRLRMTIPLRGPASSTCPPPFPGQCRACPATEPVATNVAPQPMTQGGVSAAAPLRQATPMRQPMSMVAMQQQSFQRPCLRVANLLPRRRPPALVCREVRCRCMPPALAVARPHAASMYPTCRTMLGQATHLTQTMLP